MTHPPAVTVAIIGAGTAGRAFALACAAAGYNVILEDVMPSKLRHAEAEFAELGHAVTLASTVEDAVRDADIAIDFVPDELESKLEIFSMIDRMAPPRTVMLTPSQTLSITDLASCTYRADRCLMMRDAAPTRLLFARGVAPATLSLATALLESLGQATLAEHDPDLPQLMKNQGYVTAL